MIAKDTFTAEVWDRLTKAHRTHKIFYWVPPAALLGLLLMAVLFDEPVSRALMAWPAHERAFFLFITDIGKSDWMLYPTLLGMLVGWGASFMPLTYRWAWAMRSLLGVSAFIFIMIGLTGLITAFLKRAIGRARPYFIDEYGALYFEPFSWLDWRFQSFPSGHSTTAMAFAVVLLTLANDRWRGPIIGLGLAIGLSRIVGADHYLTDVLVGLAWGTVGAFIIRDYFLTRNWGMRRENGRVRFRMFAGFKPLWRSLVRGQVPKMLK